MKYQTVSMEIADRVAWITLSRPDQRNALNEVMMRELTETLLASQRDPHVRAVILKGEGKTFCSGMDLAYLQEFSARSHEENIEDAQKLLKLLKCLYYNKKLTIAAVHGPALGGGCGIASCCDYVFISAENGMMGVPEVRLGFVPALIFFFLCRRMGFGRAKEFALRGAMANAREAVELGLASRAIEGNTFLEEVKRFAQETISQTSAASVALTKELISRMDEMDLSEGLDYAASVNALSRKTEEFQRGIQSFLTKEKLKW